MRMTKSDTEYLYMTTAQRQAFNRFDEEWQSNQYKDMPKRIMEDLRHYVVHGGTPKSHFLFNLLVLDAVAMLRSAVKCGLNQQQMQDLSYFIYNAIPAECWGSLDAYQEWKGA